MDILQLIKRDHDLVKNALTELKSTTDNTLSKRQDLFETILTELSLHLSTEEDTLYQAFKGKAQVHELLLESLEEHYELESMLDNLSKMPVDQERWIPKLVVLIELLILHAGKEEIKVFQATRDLFNSEQLNEMGRQFELRKNERRTEIKKAA
ncbi:MAG: hypothetical protein A2X42_02780 [Candidatus Margulisbacteria bacterium GWF2_38_17]|nr:MAG: hypothetical protein A2X42_02780 [Candidatus Margulisbacteria bacterium GWF2_38_17]